MQKRAFCALWMAVFAILAGFPTWNASASLEVWLFTLLSPAVAGAITGAVLQAPVIGGHGTLLGAALTGTLCAALSLPLMIFGFTLPSLLAQPTAFGAAIFMVVFASLFAAKAMWWSILPMGALGGLTLQLAWRSMRERRRATPDAGSPAV